MTGLVNWAAILINAALGGLLLGDNEVIGVFNICVALVMWVNYSALRRAIVMTEDARITYEFWNEVLEHELREQVEKRAPIENR